MRVEEEERRRISRELHDEVGQSLLVVRLYLEMVQNSLPPEQKVLIDKLDEARRVAEGTIGEMRRLISALSPNVLEELGLGASIRQTVKNFGRTFPGRVRVRMSNVESLPKGTEIMMYRLVQECISNAVKHSNAQNVNLQLARRNGCVSLRMQDDGARFRSQGGRPQTRVVRALGHAGTSHVARRQDRYSIVPGKGDEGSDRNPRLANRGQPRAFRAGLFLRGHVAQTILSVLLGQEVFG